MKQGPTLRTTRLIMRPWKDSDHEPFAELNADPTVMEHYPAPLSRAQSDQMISRIEEQFDAHGFGLWAIEVEDVAPFIGYVGLNVPQLEAPFMPCVEVGWRLAHGFWGHGYATEAGREALEFGFRSAGLEEIVSFTYWGNMRSRRVMERLGMQRDPAGDFDHPSLPEGHRLRRHVLYRLGRSASPP